ncbi:hypothetical protein CSUI_008894 [Cystoisospora suis]|uniref:Uncharacterized protein n=1 Tax=Cystoisospora suis TaxID=483139 RepID=A0A2C6KIA1_9APIC|nr:hypothetical protein CSUI_008894 [Cystoisospora suis]
MASEEGAIKKEETEKEEGENRKIRATGMTSFSSSFSSHSLHADVIPSFTLSPSSSLAFSSSPSSFLLFPSKEGSLVHTPVHTQAETFISFSDVCSHESRKDRGDHSSSFLSIALGQNESKKNFSRNEHLLRSQHSDVSSGVCTLPGDTAISLVDREVSSTSGIAAIPPPRPLVNGVERREEKGEEIQQKKVLLIDKENTAEGLIEERTDGVTGSLQDEEMERKKETESEEEKSLLHNETQMNTRQGKKEKEEEKDKPTCHSRSTGSLERREEGDEVHAKLRDGSFTACSG